MNLRILFFDIGGVCLTNGWDRHSRAAAVKRFGLDADATERRHDEISDAFERGEVSLDAYLDRVVFHKEREFRRDAFVDFMLSRSRPHERVLALVAGLAAAGRYRLATINNESRELNAYRIDTFGLRRWFEAFFSSCYLGVRKPGPDIYRIAVEVMGADPADCLFVDDRSENVEGAVAAGMQSIHAPEPAEVEARLRDAGVIF